MEHQYAQDKYSFLKAFGCLDTDDSNSSDSDQNTGGMSINENDKIFFDVSASSNWEGGCYKTPCTSFYFKRKNIKGGPLEEVCPALASINGEVWGDINPSFSPNSLDEIYDKIKNDGNKLTSIKKIQMGTLTGWYGESEVIYENGYYSGGYTSSGVSSFARGWLINAEGDLVVRLMYNITGSGCFKNTQKEFMQAEAKTAKAEAQAILNTSKLK